MVADLMVRFSVFSVIKVVKAAKPVSVLLKPQRGQLFSTAIGTKAKSVVRGRRASSPRTARNGETGVSA